MLRRPEIFRDAHQPRSLLHRDGEADALADALARRDHVLVHGASGVGKTALSRAVATRLHRKRGVPWTHVRTMGQTRGQVLRAALTAHPAGPADVPDNRPVADVEAALQAAVDGPYVVIADEADDLPATAIPATLLDIEDVVLVAICHDHEDWLARAAPRVRRAVARVLRVERFGVAELADILAARAAVGLAPEAVTRAQLRAIADTVAGVARRGIQALRAAAELATERGHETIRERDLGDCYDRARTMIRAANLQSLPYHHRVIYALVLQGGAVAAGDLHARYDAVAERVYAGSPLTPVGRRSRRNKLDKLVAYDLVAVDGDRHPPVYEAVDTSIRPDIEVPAPAE